MAGYNIVFRQRDFTIAAGITNVKSTLAFKTLALGLIASDINITNHPTETSNNPKNAKNSDKKLRVF